MNPMMDDIFGNAGLDPEIEAAVKGITDKINEITPISHAIGNEIVARLKVDEVQNLSMTELLLAGVFFNLTATAAGMVMRQVMELHD